MECAACGHNDKPEFIEENIYFKRGPRKGQVKEVLRQPVGQFIELDVTLSLNGAAMEVAVENAHQKKTYYDYDGNLSGLGTRATLYACPKCGTVRAEFSYW